jgi:hypothetical protein
LAPTVEQLEEIRAQQGEVWEMVHTSRYRELAPLIAELIPELEQGSGLTPAPT